MSYGCLAFFVTHCGKQNRTPWNARQPQANPSARSLVSSARSWTTCVVMRMAYMESAPRSMGSPGQSPQAGPLPLTDVPTEITWLHYHELTCALWPGSPCASTQARLALARMSTRFPLAGIPPNGARSAGQEIALGPVAGYSTRLRLQTLSGAFRKSGTSRGIPARPSGRANCLRDRLVADPEPHGLPPPYGDPPVGGGGASDACHESPRNKALSSPLRPLRRGRVPVNYLFTFPWHDLASAFSHDLAECRSPFDCRNVQPLLRPPHPQLPL